MTRKQKSAIPYLLAILIGIFILFLAWAGKQASIGGTDVTDPDYYSKGLKYNSTLVEKRAARVIGWAITASIDSGTLFLKLSDKGKNPVADAVGTIIFPEPGSNRTREYPLEESDPGIYFFAIPPELSGEHLARVDFELDGARINRQLLLNLPVMEHRKAE